MAPPARETEIKIPVEDLDADRERLPPTGAWLAHAMPRETNVLLEFGGGDLQSSGSILRLRRYGTRCTVTFKGPADYRGPIKTRVEHETEVEDLESTLEIFAALGLAPVRRYEKDREEWTGHGVSVVLDRTPMGEFVEIEGLYELLDSVAGSLGLEPESGVRGSYLDLWESYRSKHPDKALPKDMVFPG
mgnify:FL=1